MNQPWEFIAECLRAELAEYGGLLHLFESQQLSLFKRDPEAVLRCAGEIEAQARAVAERRTCREHAVSRFAASHGQAETSSLRSLLPYIAAEARPLIEALISEVNLLLHRVRKTGRHNHTLLARAVELHQETLQHLRPQAFVKTYSSAGRLAVAAAPLAGSLRAAG